MHQFHVILTQWCHVAATISHLLLHWLHDCAISIATVFASCILSYLEGYWRTRRRAGDGRQQGHTWVAYNQTMTSKPECTATAILNTTNYSLIIVYIWYIIQNTSCILVKSKFLQCQLISFVPSVVEAMIYRVINSRIT